MSKPGENISKRKDGRWEARYIKGYRENGKAIFGYAYGKSYHEAREKKNRAIHAFFRVEAEQDKDCADGYCFGELLDRFLDRKKFVVKQSTYSHYCEIIQSHIRPMLGALPASQITGQTIERFASEKLESGRLDGTGGLSAKNVRDILSIIKMTLDIGFADEILTKKVSFAKPRVPAKKIEILSPEAQNIFLSLGDSKDLREFGYYLCIQTGLRIGEICALQWSDVDFENRILRVGKTMLRIGDPAGAGRKTKIIIDTPKTQNSVRVIPLPEILLKKLEWHRMRAQSEEAFVLTGTQAHIEPRLYTYSYKKFLETHSIKDCGFHALRHTFATRCIEQGFDAKSLSELLGHADVKITLERYVHPSLDLKRAHMQRLSEAFAP